MLRRSFIYFISFIISISPILIINSANASSLDGWSVTGSSSKGASTVYNATKDVLVNGVNKVKNSSFSIPPPNPNSLAKFIGRLGVVAGVAYAVEQLLDGVDWVLDPANNQIKYHEKNTNNPNDAKVYEPPFAEFLYSTGVKGTSDYYVDVTPEHACVKFYNAHSNGGLNVYSGVQQNDNGSLSCKYASTSTVSITKFLNSNYVSTADKPTDDEKTLPLSVVAEQMILNAQAENADAQATIRALADALVQDAENDKALRSAILAQLQANSSIKVEAGASTATGEISKPADGEVGVSDLSLDFPVFCDWVPLVCEAANVAINFPTLVTDWWETSTTAISDTWVQVKDWVKTEEAVETETKVDIDEFDELPDVPSDNYLSWNAYCPFSAESDDVNINGFKSSLSSDFSEYCNVAKDFKPFVILAGAIISFMIVSGVSMRGDD